MSANVRYCLLILLLASVSKTAFSQNTSTIIGKLSNNVNFHESHHDSLKQNLDQTAVILTNWYNTQRATRATIRWIGSSQTLKSPLEKYFLSIILDTKQIVTKHSVLHKIECSDLKPSTICMSYIHLQIFSVYTRAKAIMGSRPCKHAALTDFTPWIKNARNTAAIQPIMAWCTSSTAEK